MYSIYNNGVCLGLDRGKATSGTQPGETPAPTLVADALLSNMLARPHFVGMGG